MWWMTWRAPVQHAVDDVASIGEWLRMTWRGSCIAPYWTEFCAYHLYSVPISENPEVADQRQGLILVHFSAQPEPFLTQNTP